MRRPLVFLAALFLLAGCRTAKTADTTADAVPPTAASTPESLPTPKPSPQALPPREIVFQASDGQELHGRYYPAAVSPAPVVVLMHWVNGDMSDWNEVAPWLQNTGYKNTFPNCLEGTDAEQGKWWDPSWFPPVPAGASYGVFVFSFRNHEPCRGATAFTPDEWLLDAQAALRKAAQLEGADPKRIAAIGSSIGADGAVDACYWLNDRTPDSCLGALSLSPGGFLGIPYSEAVAALGEEENPKAVWCLADPSEIGACRQVPESSNAEYRIIEIKNGGHGNFLMVPEAEPSTMQMILDFLKEVLG
jgi:hypothetical protein